MSNAKRIADDLTFYLTDGVMSQEMIDQYVKDLEDNTDGSFKDITFYVKVEEPKEKSEIGYIISCDVYIYATEVLAHPYSSKFANRFWAEYACQRLESRERDEMAEHLFGLVEEIVKRQGVKYTKKEVDQKSNTWCREVKFSLNYMN